MDIFSGLATGLQIVLTPFNLLYCFIGVFAGTLVGVLPGIGPLGAIAILFPMTFGISPASGIIMLAGIYYGSMYGGSTTSILVNIPGEAASVVTCIDGHEMAKQGRAGPALGICALGSFIGGSISIVALMFVVMPLAQVAVNFGYPEYFSLYCMAMTILSYLGGGSIVKSVISILFGVMLGIIGLDFTSATPRFTFGWRHLYDGLGIVPVAMGLFGISEVILSIEEPIKRSILQTKLRNLLPTLEDWRRSIGPIARGSVIGFLLGVLPGPGNIVSTFFSYAAEKRLSKDPSAFGKGAIEGVAGPETANNAAVAGAFVPLLGLGIPSNAVMALLLGALMFHGVTPGPLMITRHPEVFWGVIASMYIGNALLLVLNLPLIGIWVKVLRIPQKILLPLILIFCLIGAYSQNNSVADVVIMNIFGVVGYILRKFGYQLAPLILAFVLGPMLETSFRQSLAMSNGSFLIFLKRPVSAVALIISALLFISTGFSYVRKMKAKVPV